MAAERSAASQRDRPLPFGLQLLLAAGIILLIVIVARQFTVVPAKDEDRAVEAIFKLGGSVDLSQMDDEIKTLVGTYRRSWFTPILGKHYFRSVVRVRIWPRDVRRVLSPARLEEPVQAGAILAYLDLIRSCEEVYLRGTNVTDADLKHLARVPKLRAVDLAATPITDSGVKELAAIRDLEVLNLEHTRVTDDAEPILGAMSKLRELNLEGTFFSDAAVQRLKKAQADLAVTWAKAPSEGERAAAAEFEATEIRGVDPIAVRAVRCESGATAYAAALQWSRFSPRDDPALAYLPRASQTRAEVLRQLVRLPHLARLKLCSGWLAAEDLADLAQLKMVRDLHLLDGCNFVGPRGTAERIVELTNLRQLVLVRSFLSNRELELIASLPKLEVLTVRWPRPFYLSDTDDFWRPGELVGINDAGLECLRRMPQLRRLVLCGADGSGLPVAERQPAITDAGLVFVRALPNLEFLDLSGTKVTPAGLLRLEGMAKLRELVILGVPIDADQEAKLRRALPQATIRTGPLDRTESVSTPQSGYAASRKSLAELLREPDPIP